ncbi:MAG: MMPL family transporter, partial [Thermodesulfobacteriota bacterium]
MKTGSIRYRLFVLTALGIAALVGAGFWIAEIDTDVTRYLPRKDPVISDAGYIFRHHPIQDRMVIDLGLQTGDPNLLVAYGEKVENRLMESGLFEQVGMDAVGELIPELVAGIVDRLPVLFSEVRLQEEIAPRLEPENIRQRLAALHRSLLSMESIGQSAFMAKDPLGFKDPVVGRLSHLAPTLDVRIHKGKLLSPDGKHLLVVAHPAESGTDTAFARNLNRLLEDLAEELAREPAPVTVTPVGAYRAALDNEMIAKRDVRRAIWLAGLGIALLLVFSFPRPWMGLLAFLPALAGTAAAFFVCALVYRTLSLMALGFGGAIISITVDHGIAYLLFLDRPEATKGKAASREVWAVGLFAALTTMGAFGALFFSDFPIFQQLGLFTALGIGFSFLFVHTVFPRIFPVMPPARSRALPLRKMATGFASTGKKGAFTALAFGVIMLFFARPAFDVDLSSMNTVSRKTAAAEALVTEVWGSRIFDKIYLMTEGETMAELRTKWDALLKMAEADMAEDRLHSGFIPSMVFPGEIRRQTNLAAWRTFWTQDRIQRFRGDFAAAAAELGFAPAAFEPFFRTLAAEEVDLSGGDIPERYFSL